MLDPDRGEMTDEKVAKSSDLTLAFPISQSPDSHLPDSQSPQASRHRPQAQGWGSSKGEACIVVRGTISRQGRPEHPHLLHMPTGAQVQRKKCQALALWHHPSHA